VEICSGRYGPYVRHGKINATLPKDINLEEITLDEALVLISAKAVKEGTAKTVKKAPASKTKSPAKKAAIKSTAKPKKRQSNQPAKQKIGVI